MDHKRWKTSDIDKDQIRQDVEKVLKYGTDAEVNALCEVLMGLRCGSNWYHGTCDPQSQTFKTGKS